MQDPDQLFRTEENSLKWTFLTEGRTVGAAWGVTMLWVVIGSLIPAVSHDATLAICVTLLLIGPTCCLHIGWLVSNQINRLRVANLPKLDALLTIAMAFAAGQITERQLHEQDDELKARIRSNVIYLDNMRRPVPPTPPEGWMPPEHYGNGTGHT